MKIIRLGAHGMLRDQNGVWYRPNHFKTFFVGQELGEHPWNLYGETDTQNAILGSFKTQKEAQDSLDALFTADKSACW